jgi:hypothetical protein
MLENRFRIRAKSGGGTHIFGAFLAIKEVLFKLVSLIRRKLAQQVSL